MLQTYKAILRGNHLEWIEDVPTLIEHNQAIEVHVTILNEPAQTVGNSQGEQMFEILEKLASINALSGISDPLDWQRVERKDRELPDRDV
jgi:hypothetical protein